MKRGRPGIALPMVLLVMLALSILSSLALFDAVQGWRVALLAEDGVRARAAAYSALGATFAPPSLALLCLQPPHLLMTGGTTTSANSRAEVGWRAVGGGRIRAEVTGIGRHGARFRLLALLSPDTLPDADGPPGCPDATRLVPAGRTWVLRDPQG
ncbi:MAG: hypothetical protein WD771_04600 [Gemmatimonadaceae bacterium]